jgi:hypothetical protein
LGREQKVHDLDDWDSHAICTAKTSSILEKDSKMLAFSRGGHYAASWLRRIAE